MQYNVMQILITLCISYYWKNSRSCEETCEVRYTARSS